MDAVREITVSLPADLVERALEAHGEDLAGTIAGALEEQLRRQAIERLIAVAGTVKFGATWQELAGKYDDE